MNSGIPSAEQPTPDWRSTAARWFVRLLAGWLVATTALVTVAVWEKPSARAVLGMGWGLILLWVGLGGLLMHRYRDPIRAAVQRLPLDWQVTFLLFATTLALVEEAVTTTMTNLAPLFGVARGEAYITASANYLDVVGLHSVVVFVPMFAGWSLLLWRWRFTAFQVFLLFGITGTLAESLTFGLQNLGQFGLWIFVYGLMVYLPAYSVPADRPARRPGWWHFPAAVVFPVLCLPLFPVAWFLRLVFFPGHPDIHFPPIH